MIIYCKKYKVKCRNIIPGNPQSIKDLGRRYRDKTRNIRIGKETGYNIFR
jgi:hypothetical protein